MRRFYILILIVAILMMAVLPDVATAQADSQIATGAFPGALSQADAAQEDSRPVLVVTPREIDLGTIQLGEARFGEFRLRNTMSGDLAWSTEGPIGWTLSGSRLESAVLEASDFLRVDISVESSGGSFFLKSVEPSILNVTMKLEAGKRRLLATRQLRPGSYREAIQISSAGGQRTLFVTFRVAAVSERPQIKIDPVRMDLGIVKPATRVSRRLALTNKGKETLEWSISIPKPRKTTRNVPFKTERYLSFFNDAIQAQHVYLIPSHLKDAMQLTGKWVGQDGYPASTGKANSLKIRFEGTGVRLYLKKLTDEGSVAFYIDDSQLNVYDWYEEDKDRKELLLAEALPHGIYTLMVVCREGRLVLDGIKTLGAEVNRGPPGWINMFPISGTTTIETDFINFNVNTTGMTPGYYAEDVVLQSNGGDETVEVFLEIPPDPSSRFLDVFLFSRELDHVFTADVAEAEKLAKAGYQKEGIAFRLFSPGVPGTTGFFRWYNPEKADRYYSYDRSDGKKLPGYIFEGSIGNIATSKMTNTRELYRWVHPTTGRYYYSTNPKGGTGLRKGYRFEGIAGYVR